MSKKKKYILIGIGVVVLISLLSKIGSCNSNNEDQKAKEVIIKAAQTEIKGDLKGFYEVVDKNYKIEFGDYGTDKVVVELKRTSEDLPYDRKDIVNFFDAKNSSAGNCVGFGIEVLNANGDVIKKVNPQESPYSPQDVDVLLQMPSDETATITFALYDADLSEAKSFRITSIVQENTDRKSSLDKEFDSINKLVNESVKIVNDADFEELKEDAEATLEMAGEALELTGKMMDILY